MGGLLRRAVFFVAAVVLGVGGLGVRSAGAAVPEGFLDVTRVPEGILVFGCVQASTDLANPVAVRVDVNGIFVDSILVTDTLPACPAEPSLRLALRLITPEALAVRAVPLTAVLDVQLEVFFMQDPEYVTVSAPVWYSTGAPFANFDIAAPSPSGGTTIQGWVLDPTTSEPAEARIYLNGALVRTVTADGFRPDVEAAYPGMFPDHGFSETVPGRGEVCVRTTSSAGQDTLLGCRYVGSEPIGALESVTAVGRTVYLAGWALDPDEQGLPSGRTLVGYTFNGGFVHFSEVNVARGDVSGYYPGYGGARGFDEAIGVPAGNHTLCAYAMKGAGTTANTLLGCRGVVVK